jgi:hypothetical protein
MNKLLIDLLTHFAESGVVFHDLNKGRGLSTDEILALMDEFIAQLNKKDGE